MRGRDYEKAIPEEYLTALNRYYDDWMERYQLGKKLIIDTQSLDFVTQSASSRNPKTHQLQYISKAT